MLATTASPNSSLVQTSRVVAAAVPLLLATFVIVCGCRSTQLPEDVHELYISARNAEAEERHADAIVFYSDILGKHGDVVEVLLARGESYMRLAAEKNTVNREQPLLRAYADFAAAEAATDSERALISTQIRQVLCLVELRRSADAQQVLHKLLAHEELSQRERADANRMLGTLLLEDLHRDIEIDAVIPASDNTNLALCREARLHFGEALEIDPTDGRAVFGKGLCLYHEQLFDEAQKFLLAAREQRFRQQPSLSHMIAIVREARVGVNAESLAGYEQALELDAKSRDFTPVYAKLYNLLETGAVQLDSRGEPLRTLLEYRGDSTELWQQAQRYCDSAEQPTFLLGRAVALARLANPEAAGTTFRSWLNRAQPTPSDQTAALDLIFGVTPLSGDNLAHGALALERARAYWLLFPDDPDARTPARTALEKWVSALRKEERSPERDRLLADASGLLADDLVAVVERNNLEQSERESLLREAQTLTLAQQHLRDHYLVDYRLGRIDQLLQGHEHYPLDAALQTTRSDPEHAYTPAYAVLTQWWQRQKSGGPVPASFRSEAIEAQLGRISEQLQQYKGSDPVLQRAAIEVMEKGSLGSALTQALTRHFRNELASEPEREEMQRHRTQLIAIEEEILGYRGKDRHVLEHAGAISREREADRVAEELLTALAREEQRREAEAAAAAELESKYGEPCTECGKRPLRTDQICPSCGNTL